MKSYCIRCLLSIIEATFLTEEYTPAFETEEQSEESKVQIAITLVCQGNNLETSLHHTPFAITRCLERSTMIIVDVIYMTLEEKQYSIAQKRSTNFSLTG
jgi:hypothetical protein